MAIALQLSQEEFVMAVLISIYKRIIQILGYFLVQNIDDFFFFYVAISNSCFINFQVSFCKNIFFFPKLNSIFNAHFLAMGEYLSNEFVIEDMHSRNTETVDKNLNEMLISLSFLSFWTNITTRYSSSAWTSSHLIKFKFHQAWVQEKLSFWV